MNVQDHDDSLEFAEQLRKLRPASSQLDVTELFFRAGVAAASSQSPRSRGKVLPMVVAVCLSTLMAGPICYRLGYRLASQKNADQQSTTDPNVSPQESPMRENALVMYDRHSVLAGSNDEQVRQAMKPPFTDPSLVNAQDSRLELADWIKLLATKVSTQGEQAENNTLAAFHWRFKETSGDLIFPDLDKIPVMSSDASRQTNEFQVSDTPTDKKMLEVRDWNRWSESWDIIDSERVW